MLPIAVSYGDPSGIGCEIILKAWMNRKKYALPTFFIIGDINIIREYNKLLGLNIPLANINCPESTKDFFNEALPILNINQPQYFSPGKENAQNSQGIIEAIEKATKLVLQKKASAIVTCPISKKILYEANFAFPGHTEFLAHLAEKELKQPICPVMMLKAKELAIVPITIHMALKDVTKHLNKKILIEKITITHKALQEKFAIKNPRLAIAGLNPHAGEDGSMGAEEQTIIKPAMKLLSNLGMNITGPWPADTMFHSQARKTYDTAICMYHDQALIPIKTLYFEEAVNITLGLPFIRTSPDHGTAFNIAGKNKASAKSLINAILYAKQLVQQQA